MSKLGGDKRGTMLNCVGVVLAQRLIMACRLFEVVHCYGNVYTFHGDLKGIPPCAGLHKFAIW